MKLTWACVLQVGHGGNVGKNLVEAGRVDS
jgi:hypothetical protein